MLFYELLRVMLFSLILLTSDRWRGQLPPSTTTAKGRSSRLIQVHWPSPSRSSPSLPLSASPCWCTDGDQRSVESWVGPGLQRSWPPCCSSACGSSTSSSPHWRPTATSRASKITEDDEGWRWTWKEETKGRWMNGWIWKLRLSHWSITPSLYAIDWMTIEWMDVQMK